MTTKKKDLPIDSPTYINEQVVPGACLYGRDPSTLTVPQLKRWLECRKAPTKGKKLILSRGKMKYFYAEAGLNG